MPDMNKLLAELQAAQRRLKATESELTKARRRAANSRRLTAVPDGATVHLPSGHVGVLHKGKITRVRLPQGAGTWMPPSVEKAIRNGDTYEAFKNKKDGSR